MLSTSTWRKKTVTEEYNWQFKRENLSVDIAHNCFPTVDSIVSGRGSQIMFVLPASAFVTLQLSEAEWGWGRAPVDPRAVSALLFKYFRGGHSQRLCWLKMRCVLFSHFSRDDDIEVLADETSDTAEETSPVRAVSRTPRFVA